MPHWLAGIQKQKGALWSTLLLLYSILYTSLPGPCVLCSKYQIIFPSAAAERQIYVYKYKRGHKSSDWGLFFRSTRAAVLRKKSEALNLNSQRIIYYFSSNHPEINMMGLVCSPMVPLSSLGLFILRWFFLYPAKGKRRAKQSDYTKYHLDSMRFEHFASI